MELYREPGYDKTTVAEIAARAGLTPRTFLRYFPDSARSSSLARRNSRRSSWRLPRPPHLRPPPQQRTPSRAKRTFTSKGQATPEQLTRVASLRS
jgi:hypothetical protein